MATLSVRTGDAGPTVEITREEDGSWTLHLESPRGMDWTSTGWYTDEIKALATALPAALGYAMVVGGIDDA